MPRRGPPWNDLTQHNPDFKSADAQLLYARTLEAQDALEEAERAYAAMAPGYPGAEARLRYGLLLKRRGKLPEAQRVLKDLLDGAKLGPAHYRKAQAEWLDRATARIELESQLRLAALQSEAEFPCNDAIVSVTTRLSLPAIMLAACAGQKEPAQKLIGDIESTVTAASTEAAKYVPDQLDGCANATRRSQGLLRQAGLRRGRQRAPAVLSAAQSLATAAAAKKDEVLKALNDQWTGLAGSVPGGVTAIQNRIEFLSKKSNKKAGRGHRSGRGEGRA